MPSVGQGRVLSGEDLDRHLLRAVEIREWRIAKAEKRIFEFCFARPKVVRHRARSSVFHLRRAWALRSRDREMAVFRAITAEEESVAAVFHSLRRHRYRDAKRLQPRSHIHKAAFDPFVRAVTNAVSRFQPGGVQGGVELLGTAKRPRVRLRLDLEFPGGMKRAAYPEPPLNFNVDRNGESYDMSDELAGIATRANAKTVLDYCRRLANQRNAILYASDRGVPRFSSSAEAFVLERVRRVVRNLTILLLIDTHPAREQRFVLQCVKAYLIMLKKVQELEAASGTSF